MRPLSITGFCAIALLSGCTRGGVGADGGIGAGPDIRLPCPGKDLKTGEWHIGKNRTIRFHTDGRCKFTEPDGVSFVPPNNPYPPGFSNRVVGSGGTAISYDYDPSNPIRPAAGYPFTYKNDDTQDGNGSGVVKN